MLGYLWKAGKALKKLLEGTASQVAARDAPLGDAAGSHRKGQEGGRRLRGLPPQPPQGVGWSIVAPEGQPVVSDGPQTRFFGRAAEVALVLDAVGGDVPLTSIVGPAGSGKSRLAAEVARRVSVPVRVVQLRGRG